MSDADLQAVIDFLRPLSFQPLRQLDTRDVYIRPEGKLVVTDRGDVSVILFQTCPILRFRDDLYAAYGKNADKETLAYLRKARHSYVNLRTALTFRSKAIRLVLEAICYRQHDFFLHDAALHPLTQRNCPYHGPERSDGQPCLQEPLCSLQPPRLQNTGLPYAGLRQRYDRTGISRRNQTNSARPYCGRRQSPALFGSGTGKHAGRKGAAHRKANCRQTSSRREDSEQHRPQATQNYVNKTADIRSSKFL